MKSSKSLPNSYKQRGIHKRPVYTNTQSNGSNTSLSITNAPHANYIYSSSFSSSNVKVSSPLSKPWFNPDNYNTESSGTASDQSWMTRRWSTISGSLIVRRKIKKVTATRQSINRQKRRTYPPPTAILKQERKKFTLPSELPPLPLNKKQHHRQSLAEIMTTFYRHTNTSNETLSTTSSLSKRLGRILKRKGKQPYKKPPAPLTINTTTNSNIITEDEMKAAMVMMRLFQPPPTISSKSSTPGTTPFRFPTPPKRFSAIYIDSQGNKGKTDYRARVDVSKYFMELFCSNGILTHVFSSKKSSDTNDNQQQPYPDVCSQQYNRQLTMSTLLFVFGFIFFPCWWLGSLQYYRNRRRHRRSGGGGNDNNDYYYHNDTDLYSLRTMSWLNIIFSCLSFVLVALVVSLVIVLIKS